MVRFEKQMAQIWSRFNTKLGLVIAIPVAYTWYLGHKIEARNAQIMEKVET